MQGLTHITLLADFNCILLATHEIKVIIYNQSISTPLVDARSLLAEKKWFLAYDGASCYSRLRLLNDQSAFYAILYLLCFLLSFLHFGARAVLVIAREKMKAANWWCFHVTTLSTSLLNSHDWPLGGNFTFWVVFFYRFFETLKMIVGARREIIVAIWWCFHVTTLLLGHSFLNYLNRAYSLIQAAKHFLLRIIFPQCSTTRLRTTYKKPTQKSDSVSMFWCCRL